jgi:hypothetical protein
MHYTITVRRGIKHLISMGLADNVEKRIEFDTRRGQTRAAKMTARTAADIRAAILWLEQEAGACEVSKEPEPVTEPEPAQVGA